MKRLLDMVRIKPSARFYLYLRFVQLLHELIKRGFFWTFIELSGTVIFSFYLLLCYINALMAELAKK